MSTAVSSDPSVSPRTGTSLGAVTHTDPTDVARILQRAAEIASTVALAAPAERSKWLGAVADTLLLHHDELAQLADEETALGLPRLRSEIAGAAKNAQFYARVAVDGAFLDASSETVDETTSLARCNIPVGPVAVFGASNFPFGFGVFGHDVASAIAAGCPVVVKAHPAHPRLSLRLASLALEALTSADAPEGLYSVVVGFDAGLQVVDAPEIRAVAFTGSQSGGMSLLTRASARGVPVFAEMGTVNPVFVTRSAVGDFEDAEAIAAGFVTSLTLGVGQFCTKPGLMFAPAGSGILAAVNRLIAQVEAAPLLTTGIADHFTAGISELEAASSIHRDAISPTTPPTSGNWVSPLVIPVTLDDLHPGSRLLAECFGPVALVCEYDDADVAARVLGDLQGSLVASVFTGDVGADPDADGIEAIRLVTQLMARVGRVAVNSWPTGVANTWSQQHGGPWPATSRPETTSVGAGALGRFVRPVAVQNAHPRMLPAALLPANPWNIPRRIDGILTLPDV